VVLDYVIKEGLWKRRKKNKVSEMFPELSKEDLKLRKTAIINYQNMYLNTTFKRGIQMLLTVALLASIIGALVTSMLYQDFSTSFLFKCINLLYFTS